MARKPTPLGITWEAIERRLLKGMSAREIAADLDCSVQNVHYRIRQRRIELERANEMEPAAATAGSGAGSNPHPESTGA